MIAVDFATPARLRSLSIPWAEPAGMPPVRHSLSTPWLPQPRPSRTPPLATDEATTQRKRRCDVKNEMGQSKLKWSRQNYITKLKWAVKIIFAIWLPKLYYSNASSIISP
jgi:hypothetical protein